MNITFKHHLSKLILFILPTLFLLLLNNDCFSQGTTEGYKLYEPAVKHNRKFYFPPKALLIQLRSEKNRIQYFENNNDLENTLRIKKEAARVRQVMINDFRDHFAFCPVYYYMDTNATLVKQQKFENVLFDAFGTPVNKPVISPGDTEYYILYYGYPENEKTESFVTREAPYTSGTGNVMGRGLVFLDYQYYQRDYYPIFHRFLIEADNQYGPDYHFISKKFDMEYIPRAKVYYEGLVKRYGRNYKNLNSKP